MKINNYSRCFIVLSIFAVFLLGCIPQSNNNLPGTATRSEKSVSNNALDNDQVKSLREIAEALGVDADVDVSTLISGIKKRVRLADRTEYKARLLNDEEIKIVKIMLSDEDPELFETIKRYHSIVRRINGKCIVVIE